MADTAVNSGNTVASVAVDKVYGSSLLRLSQSFDYITEETRVHEVAAVFEARPELMVLGVCGPELRAVGLITRTQLFGLLGRAFGREVLGKKAIAEILEPSPRFDRNANLFHVAELLQKTMDRSTVQYYLLVDDHGSFCGAFSSKDLLTYLSKITQEDIQLAGQLQERLVQARHHEARAGWELEAFSQSAKGLGGDFYHINALPSGAVFLALGDVSGKGVAASVLTSLIWGVLQFYDYRKGLRTLLSQMNEALIRTFHLEKYLTGIFALFDPEGRTLTLADMGHGHAWLLRSGKAKPLHFPGSSGSTGRNLPLGVDLDLAPQVYRVRLRPGDLVCFYTDGLTEQENGEGQELGEVAVVRCALKASSRPETIPDALLGLLARHQGPVPRMDDVTWLQLKLADEPRT